MRKSLFLSAVMFLFSLCMFAGTTYAWFSQDVTVNSNSVILGELKIDVTYTDPCDDIQDDWYEFTGGRQLFDVNGPIGGIQPGSETTRALKVVNTGNIPAAVRLVTQNTNIPPELSGMIIFSATVDGQVYSGSMLNYTTPYILLQPGEQIIVPVLMTVSETLGNEGELKRMTFDFVIQARQPEEVIHNGDTLLDL